MRREWEFEPERLRRHLNPEPHLVRAPVYQSPDALPAGLPSPPEALTVSAVLVPILLHPDGPRLLLTRRSETLRNHSGQVSFPGGRQDPEDRDLLQTALREAHEEVGLKPERVDVLGYLDDVCTFTGFMITPVVALVRMPFEVQFDAGEVAEVFELPLHSVLAADAFTQQQFRADGRSALYWEMNHEPQRIWGATAAILLNLKFHLEAAR